MKYSHGVSNFVGKISSPSQCTVFLYFFALITEEGFLISLCSFWNSALIWKYLSLCPLPFASLLFSAICKVSSDNYFTFLHIFFFGMILVTTSCIMFRPQPIAVLQGTVSIRSNPLNLLITSTVQSQGIWFRSYLNGLMFFPARNSAELRSSPSPSGGFPRLSEVCLAPSTPN